MATTDLQVLVNQDAPRAAGEGAYIGLKGSKRGEMCILDFYTAMYLEQRAFSVRIGSVSAPVTSDTAITTLEADMCADVVSGLTLIPVYFNFAANLMTGTANEVGFKSVGAASTAGTVFVPLPLYIGGAAALSTARAQATGACTVTDDAVTTTREIAAWANGIAAGAYTTTHQYKPRLPHVVNGVGGVYVQVGATTTGCEYFCAFEYIEIRTTNID